jgi:hypothetical protein
MENEEQHETLVVAARTAEHPQLVSALRRQARERPTTYTLLVPALPPEDAERAVRRLREAGLDLREAIVGDADCAAALGDALHAREFDEVLLASPERLGTGPDLKLQRIANTSLRSRSPRLGAFLRGRGGAGVTLSAQKAPPRWRDDARTRTRSPSSRARAVAVPRSSS